ncbi:MAG: FG-GAP-like repeat-containing protein [Owenweeksia sp.]
MNKFTLTYSFIFLATSVFSQQFLDFRDGQSGYVDYDHVASERITFWPGYTYGASQPGVEMNASINPNLPDDYYTGVTSYTTQQDIGSRQLNFDLPVARIEGTADVGKYGEATYSIPIPVPSAPSDLMPRLSVDYNSLSKVNSILGFGWNLNGISKISRVASGIKSDRMNLSDPNSYWIDPVDYDAHDRLTLNGARLININGAYGANLTEYRTIVDEYIKIESIGDFNNTSSKFKVYTKDGKTIVFGASTDDKVLAGNYKVAEWYISNITDRNGNYLKFHYTRNTLSTEVRIHKITYHGTSSSSPEHTITFDYDDRDDWPVRGIGQNHMLYNQNLLSGIRIHSFGQLWRHYKFSYKLDQVSKLVLVEMYNANGEEVNSTIVNWFTGSTTSHLSSATPVLDGQHKYVSADINGDGYTDMYSYKFQWESDGSCTHGWPPSTKDQDKWAFWVYAWINNKNGGYNKILVKNKFYSQFKNGECSRGRFLKIYSANLDGDADDEIIISRVVESNGLRWYFEVYDYRNGSFVKLNQFEINDYGNWANSNVFFPALVVGDYDGDGRSDLSYNSMNAGKWHFWLSDGFDQSGHYDFIKRELDVVALPDTVYPGDYNADGRTDFLLLHSSGYYMYSLDYVNGTGVTTQIISSGSNIESTDYVAPGDFNGDGKIDLLTKDGGAWEMWIFDGNVYIPSPEYIPLTLQDPHAFDHDHLIVSDFDGNGLSDIMEITESGSSTQFKVHYKKPYTPSSTHSFDIETFSYNDYEGGRDKYFPNDINGDGSADLVSVTYPNPYSIIVKPNYMKNLVSTISDGYGEITDYTYRLLTNSSVYQTSPSLGYPFATITPAQYVVYQLQTKTINNQVIDSYRMNYKNATVFQKEFGYQGFREVSKTNLLSGTEVISEFAEQYAFFFQVGSKTKKNGTVIRESISEYDVSAHLTNDLLSTYLEISLDKVSLFDYLKDTKTVDDHTYDQYGNITNKTVKYYHSVSPSAPIQKTETITNQYGQYEGWCNNRKTQESITTTIASEPAYTKTNKFHYYTNGNLHYTEEFFGLPKMLTTTYSYDARGNLTSTVTSAAGETSRFTNLTYDPTSSFVISKTNTLGHEQSFTYNPSTGALLEVVDANNQKTTYSYDGFDRPIQITDHVHVTTDVTWDWDKNSEGPNGSLYYVQKVSSTGTPPKKEFFDGKDQLLRTVTENLDGEVVYKDQLFDSQGRLWKQSLSYFPGNQPIWTTSKYDSYGRLEEVASPTKTTSITYEGRTEIVNYESTSQVKTSVKTAWDALEYVNDNGSSIFYIYHSNGNIKQIDGGGNLVTFEYDPYGRHEWIQDRDAGRITYEYNAFGELVYKEDANGNGYNKTYDAIGRLVAESGPDGDYTYTYDGYHGTGFMETMSGPEDITYEYRYNDKGQIKSRIEVIDGETYKTDYTYNSFGALDKMTYPSGFAITHEYNQSGFLTSVKNANDNSMIWKAYDVDELGNFLDYENGNSLHTRKTFDEYFYPKEIEVDNGVLHMEYVFDVASGNLDQREDHNKGLIEEFGYDDLDQLRSITQNYGSAMETEYADGAILSKAGVGEYRYGTGHRLDNISTDEPSMSTFTQDVSFTSFNKIETIQEDIYEAEFFYGPDQSRKKMIVKEYGGTFYSRTYIGDHYEIEDHTIKGNRRIHYIRGGDGLTAIYVLNEEDEGVMYYTHKDYLKSILSITDSEGDVVEEYSFDAWGKRRNPDDWSYDNISSERLFDRGFTGHEHLYDAFDIINMNGRIYDPTIGMFLSPDPFMQNVTNVSNLNRYAYAFNNPLRFTDPSGEIIETVIYFALVYGVGNLAAKAIAGEVKTFGDGVEAFAIGALAGAAIGVGVHFGWQVPWIQTTFKVILWAQGTTLAAGILSGIGQGLATDDYTTLRNSFTIFFGQFYTNERYSFGEQVLSLISLHSWELIQEQGGLLMAQVRNIFTGTGDFTVSYFDGAVLSNYDNPGASRWGLTLGNQINSQNLDADPRDDDVFAHEYGHIIQSRFWGPLYLIPGISSLATSGGEDHDTQWTERHANFHGARYFEKYYPGFIWNDEENPRTR